MTFPMLLSSCFTVNHFKLGKRYNEDVKRYEALNDEGENSSNAQVLEYVRQYLEIARGANWRWNNARARLFLDMAEEYMDHIENAPQIPPGLMEIYERTQPDTPHEPE